MELTQRMENSLASKGMEGEPWMEKFREMCLHNRFTPTSLINLMTYYARNIQPSVNECQTRPLMVDKLRGSISETLLFFLYCYRAQGEAFQVAECTTYMDTMSDLLAMYIDIELQTSKRSYEIQANISARLTSYLYVCLDNSHEHLMDTLLKVQFLSSTYQQILDPLIEKVLSILPQHPASGVMYVRYFLIYRIWKRINKGSPVKNNITTRARSSLLMSPPALSPYLIDNVLPKVPNNQKLTTDGLLTQKFDLEKSAENFLKFVQESRELSPPKTSEFIKPEDNPQVTPNISSQSNNQSSSILKINTDKLSEKSKVLPRRLAKKLGQVVLIDLTNDETMGKVLKQKKKISRRLSWLQDIGKRKINASNKEDSNTEDSSRLNLSLFITGDVAKQVIIDEQLATETSALGIGSVRLTGHEPIELSDQTIMPTSSDSVILSSSDISTTNAEARPITTHNDAIESNIKVQMEIENEFDVTIEITELKCEDNISENFKNEIIDDTNTASTNLVMEYKRDTVLHINPKLEEKRREILVNSPEKISNSEYQEQHIDGLSLLASVSQSVSHLSTSELIETSGYTNHTTREIIKVKDYKSLTELPSGNYVDSHSNNSVELSNTTPEIYPDDDIDKVAYEVEVSSFEDARDTCESALYHPKILNESPTDTITECADTSADSSLQSEREETNVILSGETVFLYQKSPNSNLYIINKAVENREGEDTPNLSDKVLPMEADDANYPYEIYDKMYRLPPSTVPQTYEDPRRAQKSKLPSTNDTVRAMDLQKTYKIKPPNVEVKSPRRHRIRQDYNGCPTDLVDSRSIHIPATTSLYHANYPTSELYISCRQNCSSVTCGLPVNHPAPPIHSHPNSSRCTCLNCRYDIVTHCTQCIIPPSESQPTSGIDGDYYIGLQPPTVLQDCSLVPEHDTDVKVFDDNPMYKIVLDNDINEQQTFIKSDVASKLPLKKRFSMMATYDEGSVKSENPMEKYPNIPMISIAALTPNNDVKLSPEINNQIHPSDIIRRDYVDPISTYHFNDERKRKHSNTGTNSPIKVRKNCSDIGQTRPSKKVEEPKTPMKNSKRQTRLSQRKVPRVNYSYPDNETECNPSGESKRKRKKANR